MVAERETWRSIRGISSNIAFHLHVDKWSEEKILSSLLEIGIMPESHIKVLIREIKYPNWESYQFNYYTGERLIKRKYGEKISPKNYTTLLRNSFLPSDLL